MTTHETSHKWLRHILAAVALLVLAVAVLLIPRLTSGQEVEQGAPRFLQAGQEDDSYVVPADATVSFGGSPQLINMASFVGFGDQTGNYQTSFFGYINSKLDNTQVCYTAPVYLPDGATVTAFDAYYVDNTDYYMDMYLMKKPYLPGAPQSTVTMASIYTDASGIPPSPNVVHRADSTINQALVDNNTYHYFVVACPWHTQHQIQALRVFYTQ